MPNSRVTFHGHESYLGSHGLVLAGQLEDGRETREARGVLLGRDAGVRFDARLLQAAGHLVQGVQISWGHFPPVEETFDVEAEHRLP